MCISLYCMFIYIGKYRPIPQKVESMVILFNTRSGLEL